MQDGMNQRVSEALNGLVGRFMHIKVGKRNVRCPFWMNYDPLFKDTGYFRYFPSGGKRTLGLNGRLVREGAIKEGLDLDKSSQGDY